MTQEDKELLLKDLCARLPYDVKIHYHYSNSLGKVLDEDRELDFSDVETLKYNIENQQNDWCDIFWKPYLRPLNSITEEEKKELSRKYNWWIANDIIQIRYHSDGYWDDETDCPTEEYFNLLNWLNKHHFDYRGLIDSGLALVAPEGMYE